MHTKKKNQHPIILDCTALFQLSMIQQSTQCVKKLFDFQTGFKVNSFNIIMVQSPHHLRCCINRTWSFLHTEKWRKASQVSLLAFFFFAGLGAWLSSGLSAETGKKYNFYISPLHRRSTRDRTTRLLNVRRGRQIILCVKNYIDSLLLPSVWFNKRKFEIE